MFTALLILALIVAVSAFAYLVKQIGWKAATAAVAALAVSVIAAIKTFFAAFGGVPGQ